VAETTKKNDILEAALDLFVEKGISAATTREIAKRAETAEGNLYRHFPSKDALARHLFGECAGRFRKALCRAAATEEDPARKIRTLVVAIFRFAEEEPNAFSYLILSHHREFATGPIRNPRPLPKDIFVEAIGKGIEKGVFRDVDPGLATSWVVGMVQRTITFQVAGRIGPGTKRVVEETARAALRALETDPR